MLQAGVGGLLCNFKVQMKELRMSLHKTLHRLYAFRRHCEALTLVLRATQAGMVGLSTFSPVLRFLLALFGS